MPWVSITQRRCWKRMKQKKTILTRTYYYYSKSNIQRREKYKAQTQLVKKVAQWLCPGDRKKLDIQIIITKMYSISKRMLMIWTTGHAYNKQLARQDKLLYTFIRNEIASTLSIEVYPQNIQEFSYIPSWYGCLTIQDALATFHTINSFSHPFKKELSDQRYRNKKTY